MSGTRAALATDCESIWREALARLQAARLVSDALASAPLEGDEVRVLALGKAAAPMIDAALRALGARARDALCVHPEGTAPPALAPALAAGHPRPTAGSLAAGGALLAWADAGGGAPALVLLSGGGSALAVAPAPGIAPGEKID